MTDSDTNGLTTSSPIDPLPSYVWYQDMADFAEGISDDTAGCGWAGLSGAGEPSVGSRTSCMRSSRISSRRGTPSATRGPAEPSNGWWAKRSSTTTLPSIF